MKGEFYKAPGRLRHELKEELRPLVEQRLLSEEPDDIVRNNWHKLLQKFEELIQRKKDRIQRRLNEIQQKLGDIKLEDIEKSLEKIRKKQRELKEELRISEEVLEIIFGSEKELLAEMIRIKKKQMEIERELKIYEMLEKDYIRGRPVSEFERIFQGRLMSEVEELRRKERELREELRRLEEDLRNIERKEEYRSAVAFHFIKYIIKIGYIGEIDDLIRGFIRDDKYRLVEPYLKKFRGFIKYFIKYWTIIRLNIGEIDDPLSYLIRSFVGEDKNRFVEPYLKKLKEMTKLRMEEERLTKLRMEEERLESEREKLLESLEELEKIKKELEKIKFIEARSDEDKIREFIKDIIREMRREKVISYKPKLQESPEHWNNLWS